MGLPCASLTVSVRAEVLVPSAVTDAGLAAIDETALLGAPTLKVTPAATVAAPRVAVTVLLSARVEARVAVNPPEASVTPEAGVKVLAVPLLVRLTLWPLMRLPWA